MNPDNHTLHKLHGYSMCQKYFITFYAIKIWIQFKMRTLVEKYTEHGSTSTFF